MSDRNERMTDEEFSDLIARSICNPRIWQEARRARAAELSERQRADAAEKRVQELELALTKVYGIGHDKDCMLCGFKDRFASEALSTPPQETERKP